MAITLLSLTAGVAQAQTVGALSDADNADNTVAEDASTGTAVGITAQAATATTSLSGIVRGGGPISLSGMLTHAMGQRN